MTASLRLLFVLLCAAACAVGSPGSVNLFRDRAPEELVLEVVESRASEAREGRARVTQYFVRARVLETVRSAACVQAGTVITIRWTANREQENAARARHDRSEGPFLYAPFEPYKWVRAYLQPLAGRSDFEPAAAQYTFIAEQRQVARR